MERKIGEIFEYNGEWYQCIPDTTDDNCNNCFFQKSCSDITGDCSSTARSDGKSVAFKKLEKVGEPYLDYCPSGRVIYFQRYKCYQTPAISKETIIHWADDISVSIEIKQTKEDMEEKKLNLKPFDIQKAREGKPVCTRDGKKARIICFDYNGETGDYPIVALVHYNKGNKCYERVLKYTSDGWFNKYGDCQHDDDLMMLPEKRSGWINVKKDASLFKSREEAEKNCTKDYTPVRVEFEI